MINWKRWRIWGYEDIQTATTKNTTPTEKPLKGKRRAGKAFAEQEKTKAQRRTKDRPGTDTGR